MTLAVTHTKVDAIPDNPIQAAEGRVLPSDWNAVHSLSGTLDDAQLPDKITAGGPVGSATVVPVITYDAKGRLTAVTTASITQPAAANPTASVGLSAVNGSAGTFMRSDGAPALDQTAAFALSHLGLTHVDDTTAASNAVTGSITTAGGIGVSKGVFASGNINGSNFISAGSAGYSAANASFFFWATRSAIASGADGSITFSNNNVSNASTLTIPSNAVWQLGAADAASPVAQGLRVQSVVAGTTDTAGTDWTRRASLATGTAAGGNIVEQTGFSAKSTGSSQGTAIDREIVVAKGKVLTSAAAFSIVDIALSTLAMCGGSIEATIVCTNGTDMQSFSQSVSYSAVNKGGVYTTSITASTGDKSLSAGTLTTSWTIVSGTNKITIKVTPTTSLTPSTNSFLLYYRIKNNSEQATTIL